MGLENKKNVCENNHLQITVAGNAQQLWSYRIKSSGEQFPVAAPVFEIDGVTRQAELCDVYLKDEPVTLRNGCTEYSFEGKFVSDPTLSLEMIFRIANDNPVVRFCYRLHSTTSQTLTKSHGTDELSYLSVNLASLTKAKEVRFSEFNEMVHSFVLSELPLETRQFENESRIMGPMLLGADENHTLLTAYEHGSQVPDAFLEFRLNADRMVQLCAVKGNYYNGQTVAPDRYYETIWLQFAAVNEGEEALANAYRTFVLKYMSVNLESREPYIFYNTWAYQERNKWWNGNYYLDSMYQVHILKEIDIAHQMGIEVFVLDTGWYEKTGDWAVNLKRFPDALKAVKKKLDDYNMKLGLWFGPTSAALTSKIFASHQDSIMSWQGKIRDPHTVWETEESHSMCLVSSFSDTFIEELIRLVKEVGVTYFKWDAIHQYGCDDPNHWHGNANNSFEERADCYAFELGRQMSRIVERVSEACPEIIVDFDITEGHRYVGLGFLSAGKYFLINNGPYYANYDIPIPETQWSNIFVYGGPARGWICRTPLTFDKWIPSVLFLTHYLPDDPYPSQIINIASLILGQNGIWGDLLQISEEGVATFGRILGLYKQIRRDLTESSPVRRGAVGGNPEIHEKISSANGRGAIVVFASAVGTYSYITEHRVSSSYWHNEGVSVSFDSQQRAVLNFQFEQAGAKIIFFGVEQVEENQS